MSLNAQAVCGFSRLFSKQMTPYHSATLLHPNFSALPYKYGLTSLTESSRRQNNLSYALLEGTKTTVIVFVQQMCSALYLGLLNPNGLNF